jgi:antitoxin component YwqK of YwqJK toxin-antitoxin module
VLANGKLETLDGEIAGEVLHGKVFLFFKDSNNPFIEADYYLGQPHRTYKEWMSDGEPVTETEYKFGVKHGRSFTYNFGILEAVELFENGELTSVTFFDPEGQKDRTIFYSSNQGTEKRIVITYFTNYGLLEVEGIESGNNKESKVMLYHGSYKKYGKDNKLLVEGNFNKNLKNGIWKRYYGDIINIQEYKNDNLISDFFEKEGKPFTGLITEDYVIGKRKTEIEVKNGIREGKTTEYPLGKAEPRVTNFKKGGIIEKESFESFIAGQKVLAEMSLKSQCDGRGKGLYVDKIIQLENYTVLYMHFINLSLRGEGSTAFTAAPGTNDAFTFIDNESGVKFPLQKVYKLRTGNQRNSVTLGEIVDFVLVFKRIPDTVNSFTLIEGNEAYTINEDGRYSYHWGCYDLLINKTK